MRSTAPSRPSPNSLDPSPAEFAAVDAAFLGALRPPERLSVAEWSDRYRVLSGRAASEPGRWRTDRTPYLREIMEALSPSSPVETVVFMAGAQVGKTECGNNWLGASIDQAPGAILVVWPTAEIAKKNSKLRIQPLIEATPVLRDKVKPNRERDSGNTILSKDFPGGILLITGANASAGLKSTPAGKLFCDEVDVYPPDVDGEGDPLELAIVRTRNYHRRKIFITSTPTIEGRSRIAAKFEEGDQRRFHVPCQACGHFQVLDWIRLRWDEGDPDSVRFYCSECGFGHEEGANKTAMLAGGKWIAGNPSAPANFRSYHLSALYSPIPWYSWRQAVRDFLKAKDAPEGKLRVFANTVWGETWKEKGEAPEWERLFNRREDYPIGTVPLRGLILTAGTDIQRDRIEVEVVAWGRNLESWTVAYFVFKGDTELDSTWEPLSEVLGGTFPHAGGGRLAVRMAAIDASFNQNRVLTWIRTQPTARTMAVKGRGRYAMAVGQPSVVDIDYQGRKVYRGASLWPVGVGLLKQELYQWLRVEKPTDPEKPFPGGFCHFPMLPEEHFRQLCAERLVKKVKRGYAVHEWEKTRERNEALDCRIYARAAGYVIGLDQLGSGQWARHEKALGLDPKRSPRHSEEAPAQTPAEPPPSDKPTSATQVRPPLPGPEFWSGWRAGP